LKSPAENAILAHNLRRLVLSAEEFNKLKSKIVANISFAIIVSVLAVPAFASFTIVTSTTVNLLGPASTIIAPTGFTVTGNAGNDAIGTDNGNNAAPFIAGYPGSGNFLDPFTGTPGVGNNYVAKGQTQDPYVFAATGGTASFSFTSPQNAFSLLWGSVDSFNNLIFLNNSTVVGTVTGTQILALAGIGDAGFQGQGGSSWVKIFSTEDYNQVELTSNGNSFEALAFQSALLPEPSFYGVLGLGLVTLFLANRRRRALAANTSTN
jgi:hypothetical protein